MSRSILLFFVANILAACANHSEYDNNKTSISINGYCIVELTVTVQGRSKDEKIKECHPEGYGFGEATLKIVRDLKFNPKIENGVALEVLGVLYRFNYDPTEI